MKEFETISEFMLLHYAMIHLSELIKDLYLRLNAKNNCSTDANRDYLESRLSLYLQQYDELLERYLTLARDN